jgi:ubiquinone/menaquinone biosynthesis C-methylase UbiE
MNLSKQYNNFAVSFAEKIDSDDNISRAAFYNALNFEFKGKKLLDLACGDGADLIEYEKRGAECFGVDSSEELIGLAKTRGTDAKLSVDSMMNTGYESNFFDIVLSKYAIGTANNINDVFREVSRILKSGGIFAYLTTHPMRLFLENKNKQKSYFKKEEIPLSCFGGAFVITEPSHTFNDFFSSYFLKKFKVSSFSEYYDPQSADFVGRDTYPDFFIIIAIKK